MKKAKRKKPVYILKIIINIRNKGTNQNLKLKQINKSGCLSADVLVEPFT